MALPDAHPARRRGIRCARAAMVTRTRPRHRRIAPVDLDGASPLSPRTSRPSAAQMVDDIAALARETRAETGKPAFDERVMAVMAQVPRHEFVPADQVRVRLPEPAAADRPRADHLAALHRRADDRSGARGARPQGARGRHRLGLPGGGDGAAGQGGLHHRDRRAAGAAGRRSACRRWATRNVAGARSATATTAGRSMRRTTPSSSPRRPATFRRRWCASSSPAAGW